MSDRQELGEHARLTAPVRVTRRRDPQVADSKSLAVSLQPRLDLELSDRLDLGTELILRHEDTPDLVLVTVGGHLAPIAHDKDRHGVEFVVICIWYQQIQSHKEPPRGNTLYYKSTGI